MLQPQARHLPTRRQCLAAALCTLMVPTAMAATLEVAGSTTVQKAINEPTGNAAKAANGVEVKMLPVGSGKRLAMLAEGRVTVAAVSDSLDDSVTAAKKAGMGATPANLKFHTPVVEKMVPIVHPENGVKSLSKDQLRDLFTGKVSNWKDVGGADMPVVLVVPAPGSGTRGVLEKQVLGSAAIAASAKVLRTSSAELAEVARDKAAIGYVGDGAASTAKVKEVAGPDVSHPLALVTLGDPSPEVAKLIAYWKSADAQKLFAK
ncbi:MAG: substrate-binding domain-containing protein [Rubrivivax sp.]